jgi:hypothetical protein
MNKQYTPPDSIAVHTGDYPMSLVGNDAQLMVRIVNMGIDAWLTAVTNSSFDWINDNSGIAHSYNPKLVCVVSPGDLMVILRRLAEIANSEDEDSDTASDLLGDIISTFDSGEVYEMIKQGGQLSYLSERFFVPFEHEES